MDSSSWIHGYTNSNGANSGFMCGYAASCVPVGLQCREDQEEEEELLVSSQIQHHLNQISMHMSMDEVEPVYDDVVPPPGDGGTAVAGMQSCVVDVDFLPSHHARGGFPSSSSSSSFLSASLSCSPESSAHVLTPPATGAGAAGCLQYPEVSSHVPPLATVAPAVILPYDDDHQYMNLFHDTAAVAAAPEMSTSAFRRYARHLGARRRPKPGAVCGQRMFKTAMSVLAKMHMAMRSSHRYYYQQASTEAAAEPAPPSGNQLQHMISERKRREKLNDSFHALKTVLPPGSKKDKTSILITAREYVKSLKSKVSELEEKNQALESRLLARRAAGEDDTVADEKVEIQITRAAAAEDVEPREICTVKIAVRSLACGNNMTGVVLRTLQRLNDQMEDDVTLVAMSTSDGDDGGGDGAGGTPRASLTLQLKSACGAKWEEAAVKEAVTKAVADALPSQSAEATAARRGGARRLQH